MPPDPQTPRLGFLDFRVCPLYYVPPCFKTERIPLFRDRECTFKHQSSFPSHPNERKKKEKQKEEKKKSSHYFLYLITRGNTINTFSKQQREKMMGEKNLTN